MVSADGRQTAAFMLPALHRIAQMPANKGVGVQVLVLTPTRELALQVTDATATYGRKLADLRTATVVGGMPWRARRRRARGRAGRHPGRLIDHPNAGRVKLNTVHTLVLDEADRMLDMGFIEDIETIIGRLPESRQTLLFSATLDGSGKLAARMMREPQRIEIAGAKEKHTNITQSLLYADDASHKMQLLDHVLRDASLDQAIVFTSTKRGADDLADRLADQGFAAAALHGDMNQRQRTRTLTQLQRGQLRILVATDVAARGIDVQGISHAVNFDLPMQAEDYVHRIGRTGRAGRNGLAYTLATHPSATRFAASSTTSASRSRPKSSPAWNPSARRVRPPAGRARQAPRRRLPGNREGGYRGDREARPSRPFGDRPAFGDRPQREGGFRAERSFGDRPQREGGFHGKPSFGDRPQREGGFRAERSFGDRPQREGGFQGKPSFGDRPQREGGFRGGDRPYGDRPSFGDAQRDPRPFNERGPREGGFRGGDRPSFNDRASFGDRPQREGGFTASLVRQARRRQAFQQAGRRARAKSRSRAARAAPRQLKNTPGIGCFPTAGVFCFGRLNPAARRRRMARCRLCAARAQQHADLAGHALHQGMISCMRASSV